MKTQEDKMFIELHILQNFAPSNLNRDDTNSPKDCEFGGVRRARISSQCIKRAIRKEPVFAETTQVSMGERTRWLARDIQEKLTARGKTAEEASKLAIGFIEALLGGMEAKDSGRSKVLFFISDEEKKMIVDTLITIQTENKKDAFGEAIKEYQKKFKNRSSAPDVAMFGRMLANDPILNLDAACQVAHAISTHRVNMDMDFFTAVDDLQAEDESGSGMMGVIGFNSACFYRYMCIHWEQLVRNLGGDIGLARKTVEGFLKAAVRAVPTGKQNSFAAQNPPGFLFAVTRKDGMAWSLANAFEKPIHADQAHSLMEASILALDSYWQRLQNVYGGDAIPAALILDDTLSLGSLQDAKKATLAAWIESVQTALPVS
jgi:CRISPR system Cascade subunit CasC